ncbi:hypothetical protein SAMN05444280_1202 [Tangfeifania diversioriginum]|uniref:Uncharacterized protein n=1 Tax=Tangfeifania diversioriginum TaxID=1168035 RepID=A0A1M6JFB0_9BACT|nr:hypothetical protein [Tangfeifania diversioriginum]SHJ45312.1 hypothetical protein SAMN05444280_1202 [Tangfeifania diversioriginum]
MDWYWSGCAGQAKWGLEIGGLAAIDLDNHPAFLLEAVQILIEDKQRASLTDWYVNVIKERKEKIKGSFGRERFPSQQFKDLITNHHQNPQSYYLSLALIL